MAHVVMDRWESKLRNSLSLSEVELYLFGKYVDDVNLATSVVQKGYRWKETESGRKLVWSEDSEKADQEEGSLDAQRTLMLVKEEANRLMKGLKKNSLSRVSF